MANAQLFQKSFSHPCGKSVFWGAKPQMEERATRHGRPRQRAGFDKTNKRGKMGIVQYRRLASKGQYGS